jgi:hypothetical protein
MIQVHDAVPFGNICQSTIRESSEKTEIHFTAHPHGGPTALWFCFRIESSQPLSPEQTIELVLEHPDTLLGGPQAEHCHPVFRSDGGEWQRMEAGRCEWTEDARPTWHWELKNIHGALKVDVALCYPYGPSHVERLIDETGGVWSSAEIGVSQEGRPITRLYNRPGREGGEEPGLYFLSRQHTGETPGTWVLDGTMRRFAEMGDDGPLVWYVPFANIDGVMQGDYGKDQFPYDVNRAWTKPPMRFETNVIMNDMERWSKRCTPRGGFDSHAPGWTDIKGTYAFNPIREDTEDLRRSNDDAAECIIKHLKGYAAEPFLKMVNYPSRWETPWMAQYFMSRFRVPAMSFETPYSRVGDQILTVEDYRGIGRRIADGIMEYLRK